MSAVNGKRLFFHVRCGQHLLMDTTGCVFPDIGDAISAALVGGPRIVPNVRCEKPLRFEITAENGTVVATVPFTLR